MSKENYGTLGILPRKDWLKLLNSNQGLFKKIEDRPKNIIGPSLTDSGKITGDMFFMETMFFGANSTKEQMNYFEDLNKINPTSAKEYLLTITNSLHIWKEDMIIIKTALNYLSNEENILENKKATISKEEKRKLSLKLPEVLQRHIPFFRTLDLENISFKEIIDKINEIENGVKKEKDYLKNYLLKTQKELPFLFEN